MVQFPNAKINLGLNIIAKRPDGFHDISSVFYPIPLNDILEVVPHEHYKFTATGLDIPGSAASNLCTKAFEWLKKDFQIPNVHIHLHKIIPMGAGLGGGSADGAFTLKALNQVFDLKIATDDLEKYASKLGSDCPFFIQNKPKYCFNRGTDFEDIALDLHGYQMLIVNPGIHISTAEAYGSVKPQKSDFDIKALINEPIERWKGQLTNDFEKAALIKYPPLAAIKANLYTSGAIYASMSGSGSSMYGIFPVSKDINLVPFADYFTWIGLL